MCVLVYLKKNKHKDNKHTIVSKVARSRHYSWPVWEAFGKFVRPSSAGNLLLPRVLFLLHLDLSLFGSLLQIQPAIAMAPQYILPDGSVADSWWTFARNTSLFHHVSLSITLDLVVLHCCLVRIETGAVMSQCLSLLAQYSSGSSLLSAGGQYTYYVPLCMP